VAAFEIDVAIVVTSLARHAACGSDLGPVDWALCASPAYLHAHGHAQAARGTLLQLHMVSVNVPDQRLSLELFDGREPEKS